MEEGKIDDFSDLLIDENPKAVSTNQSIMEQMERSNPHSQNFSAPVQSNQAEQTFSFIPPVHDYSEMHQSQHT